MKGIRELLFGKPYRIGQGVVLSGGYDMDPKWLQGQERRYAHIVKEKPRNDSPCALVVEFDKPFEIDGYQARFAVLQLRYVGARWRTGETCHIVVSDVLPEDGQDIGKDKSKWVESHATFTLDIR